MSSFTEQQIASLSAPLAREHVKEREQGRGKVSYIEGWHAIAEANRIFGFDGWTRETVMSECCYSGEYEKAVWENGRKTNRTVTSFRCSYRARVRITAGGLVREGSGHGHGFADNPGEAHESAEKEAETDAMKRALMTFGNPFGLALYDKKQAEVEPLANSLPRPSSRSVPGVSAVLSERAPQTAAASEQTPFDEPAPTARTPNPVEPPAATAARAAFIAAWWTRPDYGVDPAEIDGGLERWDYWMTQLVRAAPNLDAFLKLRDDSRQFYELWRGQVAPPVVKSLNEELNKIYRRLAAAQDVAA